jgi:regulator of replication initiation timing
MDILQQNDLEYLFSKVAPAAEATSITPPNLACTLSALPISTTSGNTTTDSTLSLFAPPTASSSDSGASLSQFLCQTLEVPAVDDAPAQQAATHSSATTHVGTDATLATDTAVTVTVTPATGGHISNINNINRAIQETVSGFESSAQLHKLFKTEGSDSGELQSLPSIFDLPPLTAAATDASSLSPGKVSSSSSPSSTEFCTPASSPLSQQAMHEAESSETSSPLLPPYPLAPLAMPSGGGRKRSMEDAGLPSSSSSFQPMPVADPTGFSLSSDDGHRFSIDHHSHHPSVDNSSTPDGATSVLSSSVSSPRSSFQDDAEPSQEQLEELYAMMDWNADLRFRPAKRKRESKTKEARKKKHILSEQRRRNHMNEAIDTLKAYLPGQNVETPEAESAASGQSKKTKVAVLKESTVFLSRLRDLTLRLIDDNKRLDAENKSLKEQLKRLPLPLDLAQQQQQQQAFALSGLGTHMVQPLYSTGPMVPTLPAAPYYAQAQVVQQQLDQRLNELRMQQLQQQPQQQPPVQHAVGPLAQVFPQQQQQQQQQLPKADSFTLALGSSNAYPDFHGIPFYSAQDAFAHVNPSQNLQNPASGLVNRRFAANPNNATAGTAQTQQQQQQQQQQPSAASTGDSERSSFLSQQGSRLLFGVFFMMFVAFGAPWDSIAHTESGMPLAAPGRVLMSDADLTADYQWAGMSGYLPSAMFWLKWVLLTTACYVIMILWRTSRICHQFQKASHDLHVTDVYLKRGNIRQAESSSRDCLEHLGCPLPSSHTARFVMTAWEMVRHVLHLVFIGRFIETVMMYARNDVAMASMQARALAVFLKTHEKLDTEWLYAALTAFNTAQATQNLSLQAEVNLCIMLRLHGNPYLTKLFAPYIRYRSWLVVRKSAASGQELGWVYYGEAITCMCAGQLKQAARYLKKVARLSKNNTVLKRHAATYLALICTLSGKTAKGRQLYKWVYQASLLGNDLVTLCLALLGLVRSLMATNELNEAQEVLNVLEHFPWKSLNRADRILFRALQAYVHLRSGRIEPAFAIASGLHKEIREEKTVRYHAKFYSFLSYQALAEVSLGLYEELIKNNDQLKGKVTSEEMENMASASLMHVNMFAEAYPVNKPCALRCHAIYSHITLGPSAVGKAKYYCERALTTAREMKLRVEEDRCQQALQKYLLLDAVSTV